MARGKHSNNVILLAKGRCIVSPKSNISHKLVRIKTHSSKMNPVQIPILNIFLGFLLGQIFESYFEITLLKNS